jgi:intraflagellar transport protein 46
VHGKKPPPTVVYAKTMPDVESLMQVWSPEFETALGNLVDAMPQATADTDLDTYARAICAVMDIPVYDKVVESLHLLFTLYHDFESNSHFAN